MLAVTVWKNVEFWIKFCRYKPCWSLAPKNNIYNCIFVWTQLLSVYHMYIADYAENLLLVFR